MINTLLNWDKRAARNTPLLIGVFASIVFLFGFFYWTYPPNVNLFTDDADSYIHYGPTRTIGYPVVLSLVKFAAGSYEAISFVQLIVLCASVLVAAVFLARFLKSFLLGTTFILATLSLNEIVKFCFEIYTESLSVSLLLLLTASCLTYIKTLSKRPLFLMGLLIGLLILIRPSSYALLGSVFVLFLLYVHKLMDVFKSFVPPLVVCWFIGSIVNYGLHGFFSTQSFMGHNLYGKMAFVVTGAIKVDDPVEEKMIQKMANSMRPLQEELGKITSLKLYYILSTPLHDKLRFFLLDKKFKPTLPEISQKPDLDAFYKDVALKILFQNPIAYLKSVMIHYGALWFVWDLVTTGEKELLVEWIEHLKSIDAFKEIEQDYARYKVREKGKLSIFLIKGFLYFCFCLSFVFIARGFWFFLKRKPLSEMWGIGLFLSTAIHFIYFSTALFQAGYPRYSMLMWPYLFMMFLTFMGISFDSVRKESE